MENMFKKEIYSFWKEKIFVSFFLILGSGADAKKPSILVHMDFWQILCKFKDYFYRAYEVVWIKNFNGKLSSRWQLISVSFPRFIDKLQGNVY